MKHKADEIVAAYVKMRDDLAAQEKTFKEFKAKRKEQMLKLADALQKMMDDSGTESLKTAAGTAFRATKDFISVEDWNEVLRSVVYEALAGRETRECISEYDELVRRILDSGALAIFNKSVSKAVIKEYMDEHSGLTPPGLSYGQKFEIQVRRPT